MSGLRVGFCVSGGGALFRSAAQHAESLGIVPSLVVLERKATPGVEAFCEDRRIPVVRIDYSNRKEADRLLTERCIQAKLGLLCLTFDKLIPPELVDHYSERIVNVHPGLLPAFPGMHAIPQALQSGARFIGATIHEVDKRMDQGPIIIQCVQGVREDDTEATVGGRLFNLLRLMYLQTIAWYVEGRIHKDEDGRIHVRDARYGELPISPAVERSFV